LFKAVPELESLRSELSRISATNAKELSQALSSRAVVIERILLLATGTFVLTLNFTAAAADQLHREGLAIQLGLASHNCLYCAWVLLLVAILASSAAWILTQFEALRHERLRQFNAVQEEHEILKSLWQLVEPLASEAETSSVSVEGKAGPETQSGNKRVKLMMEAVFRHTETRNSKAQMEIEKMAFPAKVYGWLIFLSLVCVPLALVLLLAFALRVASLLLR
jgi:hypothetical protein